MPNHVTTRCVVTGPQAEVERFKARMIVDQMEEREDWWPADREPKPFTTFEFNAVIPMPESLVGAEESSSAEEGLALIMARGSSIAPFAKLGLYDYQIERIRSVAGLAADAAITEVAKAYLDANPEVEAAGQKRIKALAATGYTSWYPWSIANWGTKWGAYQYSMVSDEPGCFEFTFQTAWSFPEQVFAAITREFPSLVFDCATFDEGWNFAGKGTFSTPATEHHFAFCDATDELYEQVYGSPERDEDEAA